MAFPMLAFCKEQWSQRAGPCRVTQRAQSQSRTTSFLKHKHTHTHTLSPLQHSTVIFSNPMVPLSTAAFSSWARRYNGTNVKRWRFCYTTVDNCFKLCILEHTRLHKPPFINFAATFSFIFPPKFGHNSQHRHQVHCTPIHSSRVKPQGIPQYSDNWIHHQGKY